MRTNNSKLLALASVSLSVLLVLGTFLAVWLMPREPGSAAAQDKDAAQAATPASITVRGSGSVQARPDALVMTVGVSAQETTVKAAQVKATEVMDAMLARLKAAGLTDRDYRTSQYSVETVMDFSGMEGKQVAPTKILGFRVVNMMEITFREPAKASEVLDELVAAGANTIYSGGYTFSDYAAVQKQAYDRAIKDAEERGARLASLSGLKLGRVIAVSDATAAQFAPVYEKGAMGMGGGASIVPGQQTVNIDVVVTYEAAK